MWVGSDQILRMNVVKKGKGKKVKKPVKQQEQSFGFSINLDEEEPELPQQSLILDAPEDFKIIEVVRTEAEQLQLPSQSQTLSSAEPAPSPVEPFPQVQGRQIRESLEYDKIEKPLDTGYEQLEEENQPAVDKIVQPPLLQEKVQGDTPIQTLKKEQKSFQDKPASLADESDPFLEPIITAKKPKKQSSKPSTKKKAAKPKPTKNSLSQIMLETELYEQQNEAQLESIIESTIVETASTTNVLDQQQQSERPIPASEGRAAPAEENKQISNDEVIQLQIHHRVEPQQQLRQPALVVSDKEEQKQIHPRLQTQIGFKAESAAEQQEAQELELTASVNSVNVSKKSKKGKKKEAKVKKSAISFSPQMFVPSEALEEAHEYQQPFDAPIQLHPAEIPAESVAAAQGELKQDGCLLTEANTGIKALSQRGEQQDETNLIAQMVPVENIEEEGPQLLKKIQLTANKEENIAKKEEQAVITQQQEQLVGQVSSLPPFDCSIHPGYPNNLPHSNQLAEDLLDSSTHPPLETELKSMMERDQTIPDNVALVVPKKKPVKKEGSKKAPAKKTNRQPALQIALLNQLELSEPEKQPDLLQSKGGSDQPEQRQEEAILQSEAKTQIKELSSQVAEQSQLPVEPLPDQPFIGTHLEPKLQTANPQHLTLPENNGLPAPVHQQTQKQEKVERATGQPAEQQMAEALNLNIETKVKKTTKKNPKATNKSRQNQNKALFALNLEIAEQTEDNIMEVQQGLQNQRSQSIEGCQLLERCEKPVSILEKQAKQATLPVATQTMLSDEFSGDHLTIGNTPEQLDQQPHKDSQLLKQNEPEQPVPIQSDPLQSQEPQFTQIKEQSISDAAEPKAESERAQGREGEVEEIVLVAQISKPKIKSSKKGSKKTGDRNKSLVKETKTSSPFADLQLESEPSLASNQSNSAWQPQPLAQTPSDASEKKGSTSVAFEDRQAPQMLSKEEATLKLQPKSRVQQSVEVPSCLKPSQTSSRKQIMRQLVELVNIQGDNEVRCIKERLRMLEEDIRSRLRRKHEQLFTKGGVPESRVPSDKARIYSAIISENIALRDQMRTKQ